SSDFDGDGQRFVEAQRPGAGEPRVQRFAFQVLHDQEANRVATGVCRGVARGRCFADVEQRTDVRMGELRNRARLALEALTIPLVSRERRWQNLDRDDAIEACITGAIDLAHSAGTNRVLDLVRSETDANR